MKTLLSPAGATPSLLSAQMLTTLYQLHPLVFMELVTGARAAASKGPFVVGGAWLRQ